MHDRAQCQSDACLVLERPAHEEYYFDYLEQSKAKERQVSILEKEWPSPSEAVLETAYLHPGSGGFDKRIAAGHAKALAQEPGEGRSPHR